MFIWYESYKSKIRVKVVKERITFLVTISVTDFSHYHLSCGRLVFWVGNNSLMTLQKLCGSHALPSPFSLLQTRQHMDDPFCCIILGFHSPSSLQHIIFSFLAGHLLVVRSSVAFPLVDFLVICLVQAIIEEFLNVDDSRENGAFKIFL